MSKLSNLSELKQSTPEKDGVAYHQPTLNASVEQVTKVESLHQVSTMQYDTFPRNSNTKSTASIRYQQSPFKLYACAVCAHAYRLMSYVCVIPGVAHIPRGGCQWLEHNPRRARTPASAVSASRVAAGSCCTDAADRRGIKQCQ